MKTWQLIPHKPLSLTHRRLRMDLSEKKKKYCGYFKRTEEARRRIRIIPEG
jgi:hypothetical protein